MFIECQCLIRCAVYLYGALFFSLYYNLSELSDMTVLSHICICYYCSSVSSFSRIVCLALLCYLVRVQCVNCVLLYIVTCDIECGMCCVLHLLFVCNIYIQRRGERIDAYRRCNFYICVLGLYCCILHPLPAPVSLYLVLSLSLSLSLWIYIHRQGKEQL